MGYNLEEIVEDYTNEDQSWLGSAEGTSSCESGTLDADKFLGTFPDGVVPSGVFVRRNNASGLYRPYADAGADGPAFILFTTTDLKGTTAAAAKDTVVPLFWHGQVIVAKLPADSGISAGARAALPQVHFVE
jgi:hypothetical protein